MLRLTWLVNSQHYEIQSYDFLGICEYYCGNLERAAYFHQKMTLGQIEKDVNVKNISLMKFNLRKYTNNPSSINHNYKKVEEKEKDIED